MAKNVTTSSVNNWTGIRVVFSQVGQSIANNTSTLRASVYQRTTGYTSSWQSGSTVNITVDGQTKGVWVPPWNVAGQREWHLGNVDFTVSHNSAGGKNASVSHSWSHSYYGQSASSTFYFDTIPRASSIGGINQTQIGSKMTVSISRKSNSFTHQVWWRLPGQGWQNLGTGHTTSASFTIPIEDSRYLPNSSSGAVEIAIQTKNGSTNIGGEVNKKFTVYVPTSVIPSVTSLNIEEGDDRVINYTDYIQNISKLKVSILGASGIYGSTIKSYKLEVDDQILNAQSGITQSIRKYGRLPVKGTVTDSRNRSYSITEYIEVVPYSFPQFLNNTPTFSRCKQDGTDDPLGQYVKISIDSRIYTVKNANSEENKLVLKIESKKLNESEFVTKRTINEQTLTHKSNPVIGLYDLDYSYNFRVLLKDNFNTTIAVGVIAEGKVALQIMNETLSIGYITTEILRNLYVGEKGAEFKGEIIDKNGDEILAKTTSGGGNTKLASDRTKSGNSPVKVPDTNTIYVDVNEGQRIVMVGSVVMRTSTKTTSLIFQIDGKNQGVRGGTNSTSWETVNVFNISDPLPKGRYKVELMWYAQDSDTTGYIRSYTSSAAIAFAI